MGHLSSRNNYPLYLNLNSLDISLTVFESLTYLAFPEKVATAAKQALPLQQWHVPPFDSQVVFSTNLSSTGDIL